MHSELTGYWLNEATAREAVAPQPLEGEARADVCVLGGGFTGLWTALHLKEQEPALDVVVVDKHLCGSGASGRNGGFCMTWSSKIATLVKLCGAQEAVRLFRASEEGVRAIGAFCRDNGIDAQFRQDGWLWTASNEAQLDGWRSCLDELARLGLAPFEELDGNEVARLSGAPVNRAGIFEAGVATLQPARLALGLRRVAVERGVRIFENSPVRRIERGPTPRLTTPRGTITTDRLVLALNAWAAELPEFRRTVLPLLTDMVITEPAPEALAGSGLATGLAVSDTRMLVHYYRATPDGRVAFGKGGTGFFPGSRVGTRGDGPSPRSAEVEAAFGRFVGGRGAFTIAESWGGPVTRTGTGLPFFGALARQPNIVYGHGYCGNGVGPSYTGGRILASLALGQADEWSSTPLARGAHGHFPPEPLRTAGAVTVRRAVARIEAAQDAGSRPRAFDRALARFAPAGLVPTDSGRH